MIKIILIILITSFLFLLTIACYFGGQMGKIKEEILREEFLRKENKKDE